MVLLAELAVIVPTVGFDFFEKVNICEVFKEFLDEQSIEGKLEGVAGKLFPEVW